ncbi:MAG: sulfite exporter TauE/SafE family protein [Methylococcales bacterium]|nr:sulfite exporter TauE/SafE family protein [Methylococcales bacterium]MCK5925324.1 sulfite exporter TauE/SafE family protein [Methylococcales bacterium]
MTHITFNVLEMVCSGCETTIEEAIENINGIKKIKADYPTASVDLSFDPKIISLEKIQKIIAEKGYPIAKKTPKKRPIWLKFLITLVTILILAAILFSAKKLSHQFTLPDLSSNLSDGMVFVVGLISGLHCLGMCGGFVMNYTAQDVKAQRSTWRSHLLYGIGKTSSYALFGALFGLLGSLVSITPFAQGVTNLVAGGFLVLFGLNMLNVFAILRHIRIKQPVSVAKLAIKGRQRTRSPFFIGFFSGLLLGCGPLQAMYVMAAGAADPFVGAKILTLFGLGTLPALFSFGFLMQCFSSKATHRFFQLSGLLLIAVGIIMLNKGWMRTHMPAEAKMQACHHSDQKSAMSSLMPLKIVE